MRALRWKAPVIGVALLAAFAARTAAAADAEHGMDLFQACSACHSERADAIGPSLRGVYGRKSAALEDFRYSNPMRRANLVWDEANLRAFIKDPQTTVKGNRMPYAGQSSDADVDDLVAYLMTYK